MNEATGKVLKDTAAHLGLDVGGDDAKPTLLPLQDNELDGYRNGACLDLRVRLAMELLTHSGMGAALITGGFEKGVGITPVEIATQALNVATELITLADERGLIEPFAETLGPRLKAHVKRQVEYQVVQGKETLRAQEEASRIPRAVSKAFNQ